jgi:myo-inositol-1-phosphate synthase
MARAKTGIWLIGARGGVATTAIVGLTALKRGLVGDQGLVSRLPKFENLGLVDWKDLVVGGHEIRDSRLADDAGELCRVSHAIDEKLISRCKGELAKIDGNIKSGTLLNVGNVIQQLAAPAVRRKRESPRRAIERLQQDLRDFVADHGLDRLVVINVASTEPLADTATLPQTWSELSRLIDKGRSCPLPASSLYAIAALDLGFPYLNFTPSLGSAPAAICELAEQRETCHMGHDGKTGETLLKSVLAPMFAERHLQVMSWVGQNIFGNRDAVVLDDPDNKQAKVASKDRLLHQILGYRPQTLVGIEYIESLGDWKTAWDHIHFQGFLGTQMTMQFIWQGCDSLLAAPLVLDLARFTLRAHAAGERGLLTFLASFFKSPLGVSEHDFGRQYLMLEQWAEQVAGADP